MTKQRTNKTCFFMIRCTPKHKERVKKAALYCEKTCTEYIMSLVNEDVKKQEKEMYRDHIQGFDN